MEISTPIGLVFAFAALIVAYVLDGGNPAALIEPTAAMIVFGGTIGAALVSFPLQSVMALPKLFIMAFKPTVMDAQGVITLMARLADKARREGLLSLEEEARSITDPMLRRGVMLVVDGVDPEVVRQIMESEVENMEERHKKGYGLFQALGGYSPTMGVVGTVMGLVLVLGSLESNPDGLGEKIAVAFVATLYGVGFANIVWLPIGNKLKAFSQKEISVRQMMVEGVLAVQAGENPRIVREKLETFLPPAERSKEGAAEGAAAGAPARAQA